MKAHLRTTAIADSVRDRTDPMPGRAGRVPKRGGTVKRRRFGFGVLVGAYAALFLTLYLVFKPLPYLLHGCPVAAAPCSQIAVTYEGIGAVTGEPAFYVATFVAAVVVSRAVLLRPR